MAHGLGKVREDVHALRYSEQLRCRAGSAHPNIEGRAALLGEFRQLFHWDVSGYIIISISANILRAIAQGYEGERNSVFRHACNGRALCCQP